MFKNLTLSFFLFFLCICAQSQTFSDIENRQNLRKHALDNINELSNVLNEIILSNNPEEKKVIISNSKEYLIDKSAYIEDDLNPKQPDSSSDFIEADAYLERFPLIFIPDNSVKAVSFSNVCVGNVHTDEYTYVNVYFECLFSGIHKVTNNRYKKVCRLATIKYFPVQGKTLTKIVSIKFSNPSELTKIKKESTEFDDFDKNMNEEKVYDIQKKGEFHLNSNPQGANISIDDLPDFHQKTPYQFIGYEARKYKIKLEKENFKPANIEIMINNEAHGDSTIQLKSRTGFLSVKADNFAATGAILSIAGTYIGTIPLVKESLNQGKYTLVIEKKGRSTIRQELEIKENQEKIIPIKLLPTKEVIVSSNVSKAKIFIDEIYVGKTSNETYKATPPGYDGKDLFYYDINIGIHTIEIRRDNYRSQSKTIEIYENSPDYQVIPFELGEQKYNVMVSSNPSNAEVFLKGVPQGTTPVAIESFKGTHIITIKKDKYFTRTVLKKINKSGTTTINKVLFPKYMFNLNGLFGLNSGGLEIGGTISYFSLAIDWFPSIKNDLYNSTVSPAHNTETFEYNSNFMTVTGEKKSIKDSTSYGLSFKAGFVLLQPFIMRLHGGYGIRTDFYYCPLYKATQDFTYTIATNVYNGYTGGTTIVGNVYKDEVLKGEIQKVTYKTWLVGIEIPVLRYLNLEGEYRFTSEIGPGFIFGLGVNF